MRRHESCISQPGKDCVNRSVIQRNPVDEKSGHEKVQWLEVALEQADFCGVRLRRSDALKYQCFCGHSRTNVYLDGMQTSLTVRYAAKY